MVCLEETGGSLTLPGEVMSVWGRLPIRTGQTSPSFVLRWVGIVTSYCPNIVDHMPKLEIKAGLPDLPPPNGSSNRMELLRNPGSATDGGPSIRPPPSGSSLRQRVSTQATHRVLVPSIFWDDARP